MLPDRLADAAVIVAIPVATLCASPAGAALCIVAVFVSDEVQITEFVMSRVLPSE